ncbi:unnamed protein product [Triticum turgidum subsp. durum]|uniref:AB hydrolase-1 domain-containing protein n=1 Tax=Triticum turgidum subsp. durum TaxID=4567 RepID=A0A9R1NNI2_TRITD|nr:unnamed protein product [Triticum turgidum subsp. durum]
MPLMYVQFIYQRHATLLADASDSISHFLSIVGIFVALVLIFQHHIIYSMRFFPLRLVPICDISCCAQHLVHLSKYTSLIVLVITQVILVGHDFGGACISHAMEMFPSKVAKAVFLCATMLTNGHSALDIFQQQMDTNGMLQKAQELVYSNGKDRPPTAINIDRASVRDLLFNQSPAKDVSLASVSMRPIPFAPVMEKLTLTEGNYGSVRRFFVETTEDNAIPLSLQQSMCVTNPPEKVLRLKGSDHAPFFSRPQALHKTLVEIATLPRAQAS